MNLHDVLSQMMQDSMGAAQLSDIRIGTVVSERPLEITISTAMAPLQGGVLLLSSSVVEKKIPVLSHTHTYSAGITGTALENLQVLENGVPLPVENGYIILNRGLRVNDKVILLRQQGGQKFLVLSRVTEVEDGDASNN